MAIAKPIRLLQRATLQIEQIQELPRPAADVVFVRSVTTRAHDRIGQTVPRSSWPARRTLSITLSPGNNRMF